MDGGKSALNIVDVVSTMTNDAFGLERRYTDFEQTCPIPTKACWPSGTVGLALFILGVLSVPPTYSQQMSPRTFWPAPDGTRVAVFGYAFADGDVLVDQSLPLRDMDSQIHTAIFAYMQTFGLAGRTANILVEVPYTWAHSNGQYLGEPVQGTYSGFNDLGLTLTVNLMGAPSMDSKEFMNLRTKPRPILGASLKVVAPTGEYNRGKLLNTGTNRWAFRPRLGFVLPLTRKWLMELEAGAWFFTDDGAFVSGHRHQAPIFAGEIHLIRRFSPGFWASLDTTYFRGGRQTIGGNQLDDFQNNARIGTTLVFPFAKRQAIKVGLSTSLTTEHGNDFNEALLTYTLAF